VKTVGGPVGPLELPEPPTPGLDEILIEVEAAGVGNWDRFVQQGDWDVGISAPMALGVEAAGRVIAAGRAARMRPGSEVLVYCVPLRHQGAWAERLLVAAGSAAFKPTGTSWEEAAAFPVPALTAAQALDAVSVWAGEHVLVAGAGGVTGELLVRLALARGARVVATAGPESSRRLGGLEVTLVDHHSPGWPTTVKKLTGGRGAAATVNAIVGGAAAAMAATADRGRLATITGDPPRPERGISVADVYVRADGAQLAELAGSLGAGALQVPVAVVYPLGRASEALARAVSGRAGGAVVLRPSDSS
jgi:NADPH:quinone reductase-like Zn-dependent oxidoreductase